MLLVPTLVHGIAHPLINSLFVKKVPNNHGGLDQVLVAETSINFNAAESGEAEEQMWDLMSDMPKISREASKEAGPINFLEIRYAH